MTLAETLRNQDGLIIEFRQKVDRPLFRLAAGIGILSVAPYLSRVIGLTEFLGLLAAPQILKKIPVRPDPNEGAKKEIVNSIRAGNITTLPDARAAYKVARKKHQLEAHAACRARWAARLEALSA